jgi:hypothetical protein
VLQVVKLFGVGVTVEVGLHGVNFFVVGRMGDGGGGILS